MAPKKVLRDENQPTLDAFLKPSKAAKTDQRTTAAASPPSTIPARTHAKTAIKISPQEADPPAPASVKPSVKPSESGSAHRTPCKFFRAPSGCKLGATCPYVHAAVDHKEGGTGTKAVAAPPEPVAPASTTAPTATTPSSLCRYFIQAAACRDGDKCPDKHCEFWAPGKVRLPWSDWNVYWSPLLKKKCRYWPRAQSILQDSKIQSSSELEELLIGLLPPNPKQRAAYADEYEALVHVLDYGLSTEQKKQFYSATFPWMKRMALEAPTMFPYGIPLLKQNVEGAVTMSQRQVAALLCCGFFGVFPHRHKVNGSPAKVEGADGAEYARLLPYFNFGNLFASGGTSTRHKIICLLSYFTQCAAEDESRRESKNQLVIEVIRCVGNRSGYDFTQTDSPFGEIDVRADGLIEDVIGAMHVDFANQNIGGGVLGKGCVQEEIRMAVCPEMLVSRLITETILPHETILINGAHQYSNYSGYADSFAFAGMRPPPKPSAAESKSRILNSCIVAMDAVNYKRGNLDVLYQYLPGWIAREMNKAFVSFRGSSDSRLALASAGPIATGNWGCGAFAGDLQLKAIIQMCAASIVNRKLIYFTFGKTVFGAEVVAFNKALRASGATVGKVVKVLSRFAEARIPSMATPTESAAAADIDILTKEDSGELLTEAEASPPGETSPLSVFDFVLKELSRKKA